MTFWRCQEIEIKKFIVALVDNVYELSSFGIKKFFIYNYYLQQVDNAFFPNDTIILARFVPGSFCVFSVLKIIFW